MKQLMQMTAITALILVATLSEAQTLRASDLDILFSIDGTNYKPLPQVASGQLQVGTGADENGGRANFLNINLLAFQK